jgi:hypothetical protein
MSRAARSIAFQIAVCVVLFATLVAEGVLIFVLGDKADQYESRARSLVHSSDLMGESAADVSAIRQAINAARASLPALEQDDAGADMPDLSGRGLKDAEAARVAALASSDRGLGVAIARLLEEHSLALVGLTGSAGEWTIGASCQRGRLCRVLAILAECPGGVAVEGISLRLDDPERLGLSIVAATAGGKGGR